MYKMYVIIDDFVYFDHCYANKITSMVGFMYFIIYYLTLHDLRKHVTSYLCYPGTPLNTYLLNYVNMLVTVNCTHVR